MKEKRAYFQEAFATKVFVLFIFHFSLSEMKVIFRYTLMLQCWQDEPSSRPTFTEICCILKIILDDNFECYKYIKKINANEYSID